MECAMRLAMILINNGEGVDQITAQRILLSIQIRRSCPATPTLGCFTFTTGKLIAGYCLSGSRPHYVITRQRSPETVERMPWLRTPCLPGPQRSLWTISETGFQACHRGKPDHHECNTSTETLIRMSLMDNRRVGNWSIRVCLHYRPTATHVLVAEAILSGF